MEAIKNSQQGSMFRPDNMIHGQSGPSSSTLIPARPSPMLMTCQVPETTGPRAIIPKVPNVRLAFPFGPLSTRTLMYHTVVDTVLDCVRKEAEGADMLQFVAPPYA